MTAAMAQSMPAETLEGVDLENALSGAATAQWLDMHAEREAIRDAVGRILRRYDAILMPIGFVPPFPHDQEGNFGTRTLICNGRGAGVHRIWCAGRFSRAWPIYRQPCRRSDWMQTVCRSASRWLDPTAVIAPRSGWPATSRSFAEVSSRRHSTDQSRQTRCICR